MARENLIISAVSFLREPSVASSTLDQRVAFLQSKNLTQEEIDIALQRAGDPATEPIPSSPNQSASAYTYGSQQYRQPPYSYASYPSPYGPPPPPLRRDWRDWFIMGVVTSGVGYGLYSAAKRYVFPLISPPTPPQLEADKASIDASFDRAFALIDQLSSDTAALKAAEEERTEKLDASLADIESVINELKTANRQREQDARQVADQVRDLRDMIPKALNKWKEREDNKLVDIGSEVQSLKRLMENKVGARPPASKSEGTRFGISSSLKTQDEQEKAVNGDGAQDTKSSNDAKVDGEDAEDKGPSPFAEFLRKGSQSSGYRPKSRAAIPAWQMAASKGNGQVPDENERDSTVEASAS